MCLAGSKNKYLIQGLCKSGTNRGCDPRQINRACVESKFDTYGAKLNVVGSVFSQSTYGTDNGTQSPAQL